MEKFGEKIRLMREEKGISREEFCGDETELFTYKTGPQLVDFFNSYFGFSDVYRQGFPTRWVYVNDKLLSFSETGKLDLFSALY